MDDNYKWTAMIAVVCVYLLTLTNSVSTGPVQQQDDEVKKVTAVFCEYMCTIGDTMLCYPPPCPPPACVDPAKMRPTDCCEYCLNGSNCVSPDGVPIKYERSRIISGKNCTCMYPPSDATCV